MLVMQTTSAPELPQRYFAGLKSRLPLVLSTLLLLSAGLPTQPALAADTKSEITMLVNERGAVEVVDRWSGMPQAFGVFNYFSAAREVGVVPVEVHDGGFVLSFVTKSYLRFEDGVYHFVTPDFYYDAGPLDVELSLTYPPSLVFLDATPAPSYEGDGVLHWSLPECSHQPVMARFERVGPFSEPGRSGPDFQVDPETLTGLTAAELPKSADDVLKELENIIKVAKASRATDPDFLRLLDKLLAKFYYILASNGLLLDYKYPAPSAPDAAAEAPPAPPAETAPAAPDSNASGTVERDPGAAAGP